MKNKNKHSKECIESREKYVEAEEKWDGAREKYYEAWEKWDKARKKCPSEEHK